MANREESNYSTSSCQQQDYLSQLHHRSYAIQPQQYQSGECTPPSVSPSSLLVRKLLPGSASYHYHHHHYLLLIFLLLSILQLTVTTTSIGGASTELLQLQGPRNTSVERGATARLRCHLLVAAMTTTPSHSSHSTSTFRFMPWKASANQRISVQWNIDGFGFTNESLVESYGERYFMPGPLNEGEHSSRCLFKVD
ncbi:hypothetical protein EGR_07207 [Echinococcus granulosus]|uniref:Uncharacterized protein n=1 Tax=Echinococcus granulosus TaxID=6210 RepID=W6UIL2_ECHGR|nr:hypothetical protein EGR_07207 [Echinococcus granulosus]EUB57937.1 hypothetical protein EGR_07207 [Echinococcus granulosus]